MQAENIRASLEPEKLFVSVEKRFTVGRNTTYFINFGGHACFVAAPSKYLYTSSFAMPTATVALKKLEYKGFVKKVPCERDGRRTIINLTDMGKKIEKVHRLFHKKIVRNISSQFPDNEKELLLKAITTLSDFFKSKIEA